MSKNIIIAMILLFGLSCNPSQESSDVSDLINQMTLEQKAQLVVGTGMYIPLPDSVRAMLPPSLAAQLDTSTNYGQMVTRIRTYLPGAAGVSSEFPEIGITSQVLADGPAGLRILPEREGDDNTYYATAFPIGTLLASTWDTELVESVGQAMGEEVLEYGADVILGPALNLQRDLLCGRNFEYYSEDPLVSGKIAAAMIKGIQSQNVGTSVKHFAVNNSETNRLSVNTILSERALRELYLKGFEIAVKEGKPWTVMSSYNKVNGVYTSEDPQLLKTILRDEWGFEGYVMTDWGGGIDPIAQMKAGNDMIQPGSQDQVQAIIEGVKSGELDESVLDENIGRILSIMLKTPRFKGYEVSNSPDMQAHAQITRQAASEGMILLENKDQTLPFPAEVSKVAAFGNASYDFISGGTGSGDVNEAYSISLLQGLNEAGYETDTELQSTYETYIKESVATATNPSNFLAQILGGKIPVPEMPLDEKIAKEMASKSDIALITIGRNAGEGGDREAVAGDFYLTEIETDLINTVTNAFKAQGKKTVVILNIAGVIETDSWKNIPDAVLCSWLPGQEGGYSVVDVLKGVVNPCGKTTASFPISYDDTSTADNFPGTKVEGEMVDKEDQSGFSFMQRVPWQIVYREDIYVGYRYYNTFEIPVSYPFGYGLSYTTFDYSKLELSDEDFKEEMTVNVDVTNSGSLAGKEVVQVYVSAPNGKIEKPRIVLAAFGKTGNIQPGESETLTFTISAENIASFSSNESSWIIEPGEYEIHVAASSSDIKQSGSFSVNDEIKVGTVNSVMLPKRDIDLMTQE